MLLITLPGWSTLLPSTGRAPRNGLEGRRGHSLWKNGKVLSHRDGFAPHFNVKILCPDRFTNSGPVSEKVTTKTMHSSAWNDEPPNIGTSTSKRFPRTGLNAGESTTPRSSCLELNFRGSMAETPFSQEVCDHLRHQLRSCFLPP